MTQTQGRRFSDAFDPVKTVQQLADTYDFVPSFTLASPTTDYNLKTQQSSSFKNVPIAAMAIIWTDQDISIRFNDTGKPAITLPAGDSPFEFRDLVKITNIFLTNSSGTTANIKVMLI